MPSSRSFKILAVSFITLMVCHATTAAAQSMLRLTDEPWTGTDFLSTYDHALSERSGHVINTTSSTQVDWWDSYGRFRLDRTKDTSPFFAYRILTADIDAESNLIHSTMDEFSLSAGVHVATVDQWNISALLGAGYSGTRPFHNAGGIFAIGNLSAVRQIDSHNGLLLAVDYAGNGGLLPDAPLPGFAFVHHDTACDISIGFPVNRIDWRPTPQVTLTAEYTVPYTGRLDLEYLPWQHVGFYANAEHFFQGVVITEKSVSDRQFFQMSRIEVGTRFIFDPFIDASIGLGYAFDQTFSEGYDVRSLRPLAQISNAPYIAVMLRGRL